MTANPITYSEIESFNRLTFAGLGPWEVDLICRIDNAVLAALAGISEKANGEPQIVPFSDAEAIRAFMTRLTIQHNARLDTKKGG